MPKIAVVSANLGEFDQRPEHTPQSSECSFFDITDDQFPLRTNSMTPRLQARIVKMFMWQFAPGFDYYLWVDSSCRLALPDSARWFANHLEAYGSTDIVVFKHPNRDTVQQEADYLKERLTLEKSRKKQPYVLQRYEYEDIDGQLAEVDPEVELYASTAFMYKDSPQVRDAMKEWWYHTSRYHSIDQLSFPYAIRKLHAEIIPDKYTECEALEYTR